MDINTITSSLGGSVSKCTVCSLLSIFNHFTDLLLALKKVKIALHIVKSKIIETFSHQDV